MVNPFQNGKFERSAFVPTGTGCPKNRRDIRAARLNERLIFA